MGIFIAILLWWSNFFAKVSEPFLVVLNSLPKVALRTSYYNLGRGRNSCNYCYGCCNCNGGLVTTNSGEPAKALNIAEKSRFIDGQVMAELFSKIKEKENINDNFKIVVDRTPKKIPKNNIRDFADQMKYFRILKGYSQRQVGEAIGVCEDTYRSYELKEIEVRDINKINKIVEVLDFSEEPILSDYVKFLIAKPEKILVDFFKNSGVAKNEFARKAGINRRSILSWINKEKTVSEECYYRIKKAMDEYEKKQLEYEEEIE